MKTAFYYIVTIAAFVAIVGAGRFEQASLNPATQVCDTDGYRPSCVEVSHVR